MPVVVADGPAATAERNAFAEEEEQLLQGMWVSGVLFLLFMSQLLSQHGVIYSTRQIQIASTDRS